MFRETTVFLPTTEEEEEKKKKKFFSLNVLCNVKADRHRYHSPVKIDKK